MNHTPTPYANPVKSMDGSKVIIDTQDGTIEVFGANRGPTAQFVFLACNAHEDLVAAAKVLSLSWDNPVAQRMLLNAIAKADGN